MRLAESDRDLALSGSPDSSIHAASSVANGFYDGPIMNGHTNGHSATNGTSGMGTMMGNGVHKNGHGKSIAKVSPPGTTLYDDSFVDREEFVRLVIQSLRDVGYMYVYSAPLVWHIAHTLYSESAATLEAESGYRMEGPEVAQFRQYILDGMWAKAEAALERLGVDEDQGIWVCAILQAISSIY